MLIIVLSQAPDVHKREQEDERNKTRDTDERNGGEKNRRRDEGRDVTFGQLSPPPLPTMDEALKVILFLLL
jgi:hypothetical protein